MLTKPFSQACENNKAPILSVLQRAFESATRVLEIGSGTGQHAVYFSQALPHLIWQPSDRAENLPGINLWLAELEADKKNPQKGSSQDIVPNNILPPLVLDVTQTIWPEHFDAAFSANTAHIMSWPIACRMITEVGRMLPPDGIFALYGPFNYDGDYTSASNQAFDRYLKSVNPQQGIRDFEQIERVANKVDLYLQQDHALPANNRLLVWQKST